MRFTALQDFFSEETRSQYTKGLSYTVRPADKTLAELVPLWIEQGKVAPGGPGAEVSGEG